MSKLENFIKSQIIPTLPQVLPSWGNQSDNTGEREMSKSEHTPGPWSAEKWKKFDGEEITQVSAFSEDGNRTMQAVVNSANNEANARLIAAAPDLLESLTNLVGLAKLGATRLDKYHAALSDAEAALAKARGEA